MDPQLLTGTWALVTGSTRGIGQQIAVGLARLGANTALLPDGGPAGRLYSAQDYKALG